LPEPRDTDANETQGTLYGFRGVYVFDRLSRDLWPSLCALDGIRECHFRTPLDGSKHIIAQFLCPVQCSLMARVPTIGSLCPPIRGSERECL